MTDIPIGQWSGTVDTWLEPGAPAIRNDITAATRRVLDGKSIQVDYRSHVGENRADGLMILGKDIATNRPSLTWIDTFHTGSNVMNFAADGDGDFRGAWQAGEELWGWRITIRPGDELRIEHFIVTPAGDEARAIEVILRPA